LSSLFCLFCEISSDAIRFLVLAEEKKLNGTKADESHHAMYLKSHFMRTKIFKLYIIYHINCSSLMDGGGHSRSWCYSISATRHSSNQLLSVVACGHKT
jgi:hypothetical protein